MNWAGGYFSKFKLLWNVLKSGDGNKNCREVTDVILFRFISIRESSV